MPNVFVKLKRLWTPYLKFSNKPHSSAQLESLVVGSCSTVRQGRGQRVLWPQHPGVALPGISLKVVGKLLTLPEGSFSNDRDVHARGVFWKLMSVGQCPETFKTTPLEWLTKRPGVPRDKEGRHMVPWGVAC